MSSGSTCAALGCHNNSKKFKLLLESSCFEHQLIYKHCPCAAPYALHSMPTKKERKLAWLAALKLKYPPKRIYVCSFHFVEKKPTEMHPDPELYLGYDRPPQKKRRKLVRVNQTTSTATGLNEDADEEPYVAAEESLMVPSMNPRCRVMKRSTRIGKLSCLKRPYFKFLNSASAWAELAVMLSLLKSGTITPVQRVA
ncbi:uncharacterized protein LOC134320306 isoform X2 [Trichomycterus rosablanca]|uniref:uncharacterized protein LOC134320305 isoform X2 n=1 Tax=Trichomycterus rosablanca TaxID=2290929 RepID=UPI002F35F012